MNHARTHELGFEHDTGISFQITAVKRDTKDVVYDIFLVDEERDLAYKLNFIIEYHFGDKKTPPEKRGKYTVGLIAYDSILEGLQFIHDLIKRKMKVDKDEFEKRLLDTGPGIIYSDKPVSVRKALF